MNAYSRVLLGLTTICWEATSFPACIFTHFGSAFILIIAGTGFAPLKLILPVTVPPIAGAIIKPVSRHAVRIDKERNIGDLLSDCEINVCIVSMKHLRTVLKVLYREADEVSLYSDTSITIFLNLSKKIGNVLIVLVTTVPTGMTYSDSEQRFWSTDDR